MRRFIFILLIIIVAFAAWYLLSHRNSPDEGPKQKAIAESKHSKTFNDSITSMMNDYYQLTDAFVNWDSLKTRTIAQTLNSKLNSIKLDELKKDSSGIEETAASILSDAKTDVDSIQGNDNITAQRRGLNMLSQNIYDFLRTVKYDYSKLYFQQCPMAFNEDEPGVWLSKTDSIRNPYLGIHHPHYHGAMVSCGETKDTLNFMHTK